MKFSLHRTKKPLPRTVIKEGIDRLPDGIAFIKKTGIVILCNRKMHEISYALCGQTLQNGMFFWDSVMQNAELTAENTYTLPLSTGEIWQLRLKQIVIDERLVYEIDAQNVTELRQLTARMQEDNQHLASIAQRLKQYNQDVLELTRKRELLARKIHTHDELGHLLSATRHYISGGDVDIASLWQRWHINAALMLEESHSQTKGNLLECLTKAARDVGVALTIVGELPKTGTAAELILAAGGEALTNLLRHAHGNALHIQCECRFHSYVVTLTNNGTAPRQEIREGGGLSALRQKVENAGGSMRILSSPQFALILTLPIKEDL